MLKTPVWYMQEKFLLNSFYTAKANHTLLSDGFFLCVCAIDMVYLLCWKSDPLKSQIAPPPYKLWISHFIPIVFLSILTLGVNLWQGGRAVWWWKHLPQTLWLQVPFPSNSFLCSLGWIPSYFICNSITLAFPMCNETVTCRFKILGSAQITQPNKIDQAIP